jgi:ankyrin repeat protein
LGLSIEIDAQNNDMETALKVALVNGFEKGAKFLLEKGSISKVDMDGDYPIHQAAWHGFDSVVQLLLAHDGATSKGYAGRTPFFCAAVRGQLMTIKLFDHLSDQILNVSDDLEATPVLAALICGHLEVANYLLDIQANCCAVDEHGNGLLHIAAKMGDLSMVRRLLNLGCKVDAPNRYRLTPVHTAVQSDNIEVFGALIAAGCNDINARDATGFSCSHFAARQGNLEMLQKLDTLGAQFGLCNLLGESEAIFAAASGHYKVLEFLKDRGVSLDLQDLHGNTPLTAAAWNGYPETVDYLLRTTPNAMNTCNSWRGSSPLSEAALHGNPLTIKYLLEAGAGPYHRDAFGFNALDYASHHRSSLREMHKAGYFRNFDGLKVQGQTLSNTIRSCCENLLLIPQNPTVEELCTRLWQVVLLLDTLVLCGDYSAAKLCVMELWLQPKFALFSVHSWCAICSFKVFPGNKYVCKSCYLVPILCEQCHKEYNIAGRGAPEALKEIIALEKEVQPVRVVVLEELSLFSVSEVLNYFEAGRSWISDTLDAYDVWEQKYNFRDRYQHLERPGQEFLRMVKAMDEFVIKQHGDSDVDLDSFSKLSEKYVVLRRKHRAEQEGLDFICKDHEFFVISAEEQEKVKSDGLDLDTEFGRLTHSSLQRLLDKYRHRPDAQADGASQIGNEWPTPSSQRVKATLRTKSVDRSAMSERGNEQELPRPQSLKRSNTASWKPVRQLSGRDSVSALEASETGTGLISFPESNMPNQFGRAHTMPVSMMEAENLQTQKITIEMKDSRVFAAVEAQLGSEEKSPDLTIQNTSHPTVNKTVKILFKTESEVPEERSVAVIPSSKNYKPLASQPVPPAESIFAVSRSSEPESVTEFQAEETAPTVTESDETSTMLVATRIEDLGDRDDAGVETSEESFHLRTTYMLWHDEIETDEKIELWWFALGVTEIMVPGFADEYFRRKKVERDQAEEAQDENRNSMGRITKVHDDNVMITSTKGLM